MITTQSEIDLWPEEEAQMEAKYLLSLIADGEPLHEIHNLVHGLVPHWEKVFKSESDSMELMRRFADKFNSLMPVEYHIMLIHHTYSLMP